jgi:hypothetical protein
MTSQEIARQIVLWNEAISIIDRSELPMRDLIERELLGTAGLSGVRYGDAMKVADRLMAKIKPVREKAIKAAFRQLRDNQP